MEIALKGLFGMIVAIAMHYAANSKHSYLAGLIPSIPIFALFAHSMFASSGRSVELQGAAHFGLVTIVPFVLYLFFVWWLSTRMNMWLALVVALVVWCVTTLIAFAIWHRDGETVANILNTRFVIATMISTLVCSFLVAANRRFGREFKTPGALFRIWQNLGQARFLDKSVLGFVVVMLGSSLLMTSQFEIRDDRLPGEERTCKLLQTALILGPSGVDAQRIQHDVLASYVALAKNAKLDGDATLADKYSGRARAVLFGSWIQDSSDKPNFC